MMDQNRLGSEGEGKERTIIGGGLRYSSERRLADVDDGEQGILFLPGRVPMTSWRTDQSRRMPGKMPEGIPIRYLTRKTASYLGGWSGPANRKCHR
jgi:hypothetical protein